MTARGRPRPCKSCGIRPKAGPGTVYCFDCMPGGPITPPPCRRCGSTRDYFSGGLCSRCHHYAPQQPGSCPDCHAWGTTRRNAWLCDACAGWQAIYFTNHNRTCRGCNRGLTVNNRGICRLCRAHLRRLRRDHGIRFDNPADARLLGAQLFFAGIRRKVATRTSQPQPPARVPWPASRPVPWRQQVLFNVTPDLSRGRTIIGPPRDPVVAAALEQVLVDYATEAGWSKALTVRVRSGLRVVLGLQDTPGAPIKISETKVFNQTTGLTRRLVHDVLATIGMLEDDCTPAIQNWFDRTVVDLPAGIRKELRVWFEVMCNGSSIPPRRKPRSPSTTQTYLNSALPALRTWANQGHESLREITGEDVRAVLPPSGPPRTYTGQALRSIFEILKNRKLVFTNPLARVRTWNETRLTPLPADLEPIRDALNSPSPARAALAALVAFCGLTTGQLRSLQLTDIRDGHLHIDGRTIPLAEPVQQRIRAWLDYRTDRWPTTTNPHLFVNFRSAIRTEPVGPRWIFLTLNLPGSVRALRRDRILHEAIATGGDARQLCDLFGIGIQAASHYAQAVDHPDLNREIIDRTR